MPADPRQAPGSPEPDNQNVKILIVEDNLMNQRLAGFMLKNRGYKYDISSSGSDALLKLETGIYDLVLMDIEMPGMNGYECTQKIRQELKMTLPVIAMTAHDSAGEIKKCESAGMNGYIQKPIDEGKFGEALTKHLGKKS